jgi:hypothetical protein
MRQGTADYIPDNGVGSLQNWSEKFRYIHEMNGPLEALFFWIADNRPENACERHQPRRQR